MSAELSMWIDYVPTIAIALWIWFIAATLLIKLTLYCIDFWKLRYATRNNIQSQRATARACECNRDGDAN